MTEIRKRSSLLTFAALLLSSAACGAVLVFSERTAAAVREGIALCGMSVIPSLFPMMFFSQYMIRSGGAELAGWLLEKPVRALFGLPGVCGVALMTALIGGYPAGAKSAEAMAASGLISREEGERLANIAFCAGRGFAIGMIGADLYKNKSAGLLILTAQALSCIIIGTAYNAINRKRGHSASGRGKNPVTDARNADAFVTAAADTSSAMLGMCGFILLFKVMAALLDASGINRALGMLSEYLGAGSLGYNLLPCLSEVTAGSLLSVRYGLPFTAFVVGFGGLSVHFQNFAACRGLRLSKPRYFLTRIIQGALCSLIVSLALRLPWFSALALPASGAVISGIPAGFSRGSSQFGCAMLVMCLMSVICLPNRKRSTE